MTTVKRWFGFLVAVWLVLGILAPPSWAQGKVRVNWTAVSGAMSGLWVAYEEGIFKRNGLDVELMHVPSSSRAIQTMLAGEIAFSTVDVLNTLEANLKGAEVAMVLGVTNRFIFSLMARPEIKKVSDLKGKRIGITRIGSSTHTASLYVLGTAGLKTGDYEILPLMEVPNILTALMAGQIDAGVVSPPTNSRARKAGFTELVNLPREGPDYASVAIAATRSYIRANEETAGRVVRSYAEAIHLFKSNKAAAIRALQKYTKVTDTEVLDDTYAQFREYLESVPYVSPKGLAAVVAELGAKSPKAKELRAEDVMDTRFLANLEREGFFQKLWGK